MTLDVIDREVKDLHAFFEDWFAARTPDTDDAFARFESALADDFVMIDPTGSYVSRDTCLTAVRAAHGAASDGKAERIWIENVRIVHQSGDVVVASYEEWQASDEDERGRISTAVFVPQPDAPAGVAWLRVHETWMTQGE